MSKALPHDPPSFTHLRTLTDAGGLSCVDDVARALVVTSRERDQVDLVEHHLDFVLAAQDATGLVRNRRDPRGAWADEPSLGDCWGRALWGLGAVVACPEEIVRRTEALRAFEHGARRRSPHARATIFAALGAAQVLRVRPDNMVARSLLRDTARMIGSPARTSTWCWPEDRLTHANAALPEVLLAAGELLDQQSLILDGLHLLGWLLAIETRDGHLSVTPVGGRGPGDAGPAFDQQPLEVAALADACARAFALTRDPQWADGIVLADRWFDGHNDTGVSLVDETSGGGFDGLGELGRHADQSAAATLALISTRQQARWLSLCLA